MSDPNKNAETGIGDALRESDGMERAELKDWLAAQSHILSFLLLQLAPSFPTDDGSDTLLFVALRKDLACAVAQGGFSEPAQKVAMNILLGAEITWKTLLAEKRGNRPQ